MSANKSTQLVDRNSIGAGSQTQHDNTNNVTDNTAKAVDVKDVECKTDVADNNTKSTVDSTPNMPNIVPQSGSRMTIPESSSDFKDWLEGIKMVARLPGGMPVEFRRKLWLALAERYLKRRGVDWEIEKIKWFSDKCRADDEELGIQIVKDLHRTGHSLLAGPSGALNQAKLKKILMGYTRWNPEVGYCQGFNMLGAIILQVMEKNEVDSIKVMIFLIEGLLPNGYFCGSLMGLQVDMAVFRELLGNKLPKLARHLQKLQYSTNEPSVEPPLINVFTMQWFLTLFCNCIPMIAVLRIWDLIMIEGSDVLLRAALAIWKMLEDRILREVRTADDFYCKMETLSAELLDENKIDSNVLIQLISDLGAIKDLQKLRQKHLTTLYQDQKQLKMIYSKVQGESERLAVANAWQSNRTRRGSQPQPQREQSDREKIALDITILKKQYDKLKERQKQAHIILTSAVSKQNQQQKHQQQPTNVNKLLAGKHAIISKGRRGPPKGAIPPARKVVKSQTNSSGNKTDVGTQSRKKTDEMTRRKNSLTWKEINAESPRKRSDSSSYSENSDTESSTSTSLCDDENNVPSLDSTPVKKKRHKDENNKSSSCAKSVPTAPALSEIKSCPEIALECVDDHIKEHRQVIEEEDETLSDSSRSHSKFHLDLSPDPEGISSISQLSPLPDISTYFTAISPIKTPCNYFEFPDFSNFSIGTSNENVNEKYAVNEQGVTNEFFERVTSSSVFNILPSHVSYDMSYNNHIPIQMRHSYPSERGTELDLNETSRSSDVDEHQQQQQQKMSASHSPQSMNDILSKDMKCLKHVNQKSFSMEEPMGQESDIVKLNRSFSDGTIMECDDLEKIIAENSKILIKLKALPDSMESLKMIEPILEEMTKSSSNSSECEEIAAIDIEEPSVNEDGIFLSEINDIANIEQELKSRNSNSCAYNDTTKPSATLPLVCNATTHDDDVVVSTAHSTSDDVTLQNEKSMNEDKNSDALVTQQTCNNHNATTSDTSSLFAQKSLPLKDVNEKISEEILSPKFNEISALVDKLKKEVMESESIVVENDVKDSVTSDNKEVIDNNKIRNDVDQVNTEPKSINVTITVSKDVDDCKKVCKEELDTKSHDLEKIPTEDSSAAVQKIDNKNSNSDLVLAKLNTQLEKCQQPATNDNKDNVERVVDDVVNVKSTVMNGTSEHVVTKQETSAKVVMHQETAVKATAKKEINEKVAVKDETVPTKQEVTEKDSNKIIEKLNKQLQRYEETTSKSPLGHRLTSVVSRSPSSERSNDYKRELEALIKEREFEKSQKYRSDLSPSKSNHTLYDHEPRNEIRRRDIIASLETDQRIRRPFKSSPSSSLSSSPSNISSTLSSIQNTIKSLDSACQRSEIYNYKKLDKAMESIEKMCETDRDWQYYKRTKTYESPPSFKIDDNYTNLNIGDILTTKSPRNYLNDDIMLDSTTFNRYESETTKKVKTPELDPNYIAKLRCLSTEEYIAGRKSPLGLSPSRESKLTTDRYSRIDRSPTSPILSSTRFLKSPTGDRASKSAENSPSRYGEESSTRSRYATSTSSSNLKGAESYSNLSYKASSMTDKSRKYYDEFEWEKTSSSSISSNSINRRKYDI